MLKLYAVRFDAEIRPVVFCRPWEDPWGRPAPDGASPVYYVYRTSEPDSGPLDDRDLIYVGPIRCCGDSTLYRRMYEAAPAVQLRRERTRFREEASWVRKTYAVRNPSARGRA